MVHSLSQPSSTNEKRLIAQNKARHIMIISDRVELTELFQLKLTQEGYRVSVIHDGLRGILAVRRTEPDLVIVSWSLPRLSGLEMCDRLQAGGRRYPIILVTERDSADDRVAGLYRGAADCISMPCNLAEFAARVRANLPGRNPSSVAKGVLQCADVMLNRNTREVFQGDRFVQLTAKEFDLLDYLMENYFQVVTRSQILENVWGYNYAGSSNIVEVYVRYLRKKLNIGGDCKLIHTVRSVGYILREPHATTKVQPIKVVA